MSDPAGDTRRGSGGRRSGGVRPGPERLRLFIALGLDDAVRERVAAWQRREIAGRPGVRLVSRENLHITLVFLGSRPAAEVPAIAAIMRTCTAEYAEADGQEASVRNAAPRCPEFRASRYRETPRVGLIALSEEALPGDACAGRAKALTAGLMDALEAEGMSQHEPRGWVPHITVARFRTAPRLAPPVPDLGAFSPSGVVLYRSVSVAGGSEYVAIDSVNWTP